MPRHVLACSLTFLFGVGGAGCDDYLLLPRASESANMTDTDPAATEGWCAVRGIFDRSCLACHGAASALGGLDLQTDPHAALVGAAGPTSGRTLVVVGDPGASFLLCKLSGDLAAGEGGVMPPGAPLSAVDQEVVRTWIADGAGDVCTGPVDTSSAARHHPDEFAAEAAHGQAAKLQAEACVACHGDDLTGGIVGISCDTCHPVGWRQDCTFCHGDPVEASGAPPRHLSGGDDGRSASFVPHSVHVQATALKSALDCTACHAKPVDVLTPGHLFVGDPTPGRAEADFRASLSDVARWNPATGTCGNLYCHGDRGRDNGTVDHLGAVSSCDDCHPDRTSGRDTWRNRMSGPEIGHEDHLRSDSGALIQCWECHGATTNAGMAITDPGRHVDGTADVQLRAGMTRNANGSCSGTCHGQPHAGERWR